MEPAELRSKVLEEVQQIPDEQLFRLYSLIQDFRLSAEPGHTKANEVMKFAGCWDDLADDAHTELMEDIALRRQQAFSQRRSDESSFN